MLVQLRVIFMDEINIGDLVCAGSQEFGIVLPNIDKRYYNVYWFRVDKIGEEYLKETILEWKNNLKRWS